MSVDDCWVSSSSFLCRSILYCRRSWYHGASWSHRGHHHRRAHRSQHCRGNNTDTCMKGLLSEEVRHNLQIQYNLEMPISSAKKKLRKCINLGKMVYNRLIINESAQIWAWKNLISDKNLKIGISDNYYTRISQYIIMLASKILYLTKMVKCFSNSICTYTDETEVTPWLTLILTLLPVFTPNASFFLYVAYRNVHVYPMNASWRYVFKSVKPSHNSKRFCFTFSGWLDHLC